MMVGIVPVFGFAAALLPTALGQANTTFANYSSQAQPNLTPRTLEKITLSHPDCNNGPLSRTVVCNTSASASERAAALVAMFTLEELINNTANTAPGVPRIGLPPYQVWNEALHGLDRANFSKDGEYSWATSFPMPILSTAALNRTLINQIGSIIATQGRAFNNAGRYGLDVYAPNINGFRAPIWGRGQETPGEDAFYLTSTYAYEYITGIQGGLDPEHVKLIATPKHFAGYDLENWGGHSRLGNDLEISNADLSMYYTPQFLAASKYARAYSVMCSYNAVNGVPSCSNSFFLQTLLRDSWDFPQGAYVSSDCDAVYNVFNPHMYALNQSGAAADSLRAGTDIDCGTTYPWHLNESFYEGYVSRDDIQQAVFRLYSSLARTGYFDGDQNKWGHLSWDDVVKTDAWNISYEAAVEGIVLLKNDGTLPLSDKVKSVALVGPWANATKQMQGNYYGTPPYLISPLAAFEASPLEIHYAQGTEIATNSTGNFSEALHAARKSDIVIFAGGIDESIEAEGQDRQNLTWPGNQLELIHQLSELGKPVVVLQMGGGQVDSSSLRDSANINSLIWGGYPGQSGGQALLDIIVGKRAPAGRLVTTQYPAQYAQQFPFTDMSLAPNGNNPGQTYMWYTGEAVYQFGHGLFYTNFSVQSAAQPAANSCGGTNNNNDDGVKQVKIRDLMSQPLASGTQYIEETVVYNFSVEVRNMGPRASDYTAMLFANTSNAGPAPYPKKWLVGFDRLAVLEPHDGPDGPRAAAAKTMTLPVTLGSLARADELGNKVLYPGLYDLALNNERSIVVTLSLEGDAPAVLEKWPLAKQEIPPAR